MCSFLVAQDWIRKMNINNLDDTTSRWKTHYPGSVILCSQDDGAVDAIVIGRFASGNLDTSVSNSGHAPGYRLNINLDTDTIATVQKILNSGLFDDASAIYSPLKKGTATFSVKYRALQREEEKEKEEREKDKCQGRR
jgi:hypothetical protein